MSSSHAGGASGAGRVGWGCYDGAGRVGWGERTLSVPLAREIGKLRLGRLEHCISKVFIHRL